ncbi:MAG: GNAT family N-acetyltransferase [Bacteroidia bacterium]|nr:GNAT family N-acetyltransferase [Bacteroidia bacterium]
MANSLEGMAMHDFNDPDFRRLIELTNQTYSGQEIADANYLTWEYHLNPDGQSIIFVAEDQGKIVSQYLVLPRTYKIRDEKVKGSLSVNTLTHPNYRGKSLFPKLAELTYAKCRETEIAFTAGFPNPLSSPVFSGKLNFHSLGSVPFFVKPLRPFRSLRKYLNSSGTKRGKEPVLNFSDSAKAGALKISRFNLQDVKKYEEFHSRFLRDKMNCAERSFDFLKWRYIDIPLRDYHLFKIESDKGIQAIVIVRSAELFGLKTMIIMELLYTNDADSKKAAGSLLSWLRNQSVSNAMDLMVIARQHSSAGKLRLFFHGFLPVPTNFLPQPLEFILRIHSENVKKTGFFDMKKWYLSFGDSDVF